MIDLKSLREKFYRKADLIVKNEKNIIETTEDIIKQINFPIKISKNLKRIPKKIYLKKKIGLKKILIKKW